MAQWRESGLTAAEFSRGREFSPKTLVWWSSRLRALTAAKKGDEFRMARVVRASEPATSGPAASPPQVGARSGVTLESNGVRIALETGFDRVTLAAVLNVLGGRT